eukprot:g23979.t1
MQFSSPYDDEETHRICLKPSCLQGHLCNLAASRPQCTAENSLDPGEAANSPRLCRSSHLDVRSMECAAVPLDDSSGGECKASSDCVRADGTVGECVCKRWWNRGLPGYCELLVPDLQRPALMDFRKRALAGCHHNWPEDRCAAELDKLELLELVKRERQATADPTREVPECAHGIIQLPAVSGTEPPPLALLLLFAWFVLCASEAPPKLGFMELINQYEVMQQQQKQQQQQRLDQQLLRQQKLYEGAFGAASDRHGAAMRVAVGGPSHLDSHLQLSTVNPDQEAVGERLYEGAAGCRSAWRSPRQEGLRPAPGAAVSQVSPLELRVARLKDFDGAAGCLSGALSGCAPKELQPVGDGRALWPRRGSYLARSPRDREIIDSMIAGLEVTIK